MDGILNETRYQDIIQSSRLPVLALIRESVREDRHLLLPRILIDTFATALRIPQSASLNDLSSRGRFAFRIIRDWGRKVSRISRTRLTMTGGKLIDPKGVYLFVANHLSPFDIAVLYSLLPVCTGVVANNEFRRIPVLSYWMRLTGAIFVEQGNAAAEFSAFRLMVERLKGGKSLLLFPEGYINQGKDLAEFKRGGIHSAILAHVPIVPVSLCGTNKVMRPGGLSIVPGQQVLVQFGEPIEAWKLDAKSRKCIDLRLRDRIAAMQESCGQ